MRRLVLTAALGAAALATATPSHAMPNMFNRAGLNAAAPLVRVQLQCDPSRCIDPRNGAYTQSGCDYRGCYPISGIVGYTNPASAGYGYGSEDRRYRHHRDWRWGD